MNLYLGASLAAIESPLSPQTIEWLGCSSIRAFEPFPADFNFAEGHCLFDQFVGMLARTGKTAPTFRLPWGAPLDLSAINEAIRFGAVRGVQRFFPLARVLGSKVLVVHPSSGPIASEERERRIVKLGKSLQALQSVLKEEGVQMALELSPGACLGDMGGELLRIIGDCDESVGVCLDVDLLAGAVKNLPDVVRLLGKRLIALRFSDGPGTGGGHAVPGEGAIEWTPFIRALAEIGYRGAFNYETAITKTPEEQIAAIERNFTERFRSLIQEEFK